MLYINIETKQIKELDSVMVQMWKDTNNPKLLLWEELPTKPADNAVWNNNQWTIPSVSVPESITATQIRLWLIENNFSLSTIDNLIQSIEDVKTREKVMTEWEYAPYILRNHPFISVIGSALGLDDNQIDQAFIEASNIGN
jgi:hypothetical protein